MTHFAEIDENDNVIRVIVVEKDVIDSGLFGDPSNWVQTSYNTKAGVHKNGKTPLRKNFAGKGMKYDRNRDAFIEQSPFPSWVLDEEKCIWKSPKPIPENPDNKVIKWNEEIQDWEMF